MDAVVQIDLGSTQRGRKRPVRDNVHSEDEQWPISGTTCAETFSNKSDHYSTDNAPPKRHRNSVGKATFRRPGPLKFRAHALLNDLAFTKLYVTANFLNYNPTSSPVVICIVAQHDSFYRALSHALPCLDSVAPDLQALALATSEAKIALEHSHPDSARILPVSTVSDLNELSRTELQTFVELLPGHDNIVVIDSTDTCIWTSTELPEQDSCPRRGTAWLRRDLETALTHVLSSKSRGSDMGHG